MGLIPLCLLVVLSYRWSLIEEVGIPYTLEAFLKLMSSPVSAFSNDSLVHAPVFVIVDPFSLPLVLCTVDALSSPLCVVARLRLPQAPYTLCAGGRRAAASHAAAKGAVGKTWGACNGT